MRDNANPTLCRVGPAAQRRRMARQAGRRVVKHGRARRLVVLLLNGLNVDLACDVLDLLRVAIELREFDEVHRRLEYSGVD